MNYEKRLFIQGEGISKRVTYFAKKVFSESFGTDIYNVGIVCNGEEKVIEDFSPSKEEAERFCDYLYNENVSIRHLFLIGEEFITGEHI